MDRAAMLTSKYRTGFTLIEVLIAMGIIAVGLIALVTLFPVGLRSSRLAGDFTTASFIAQQALDSIRASAQVYDPGDISFGDTDGDGLGYYDLPVSAVKGLLSPMRFPHPPERSQWWRITMINATTFSVISSIYGTQSKTGTVDSLYTSDDRDIQFILSDNESGLAELGSPPFNEGTAPFDNTDITYPDFEADDEIVIHIEMHSGNPYYWHAMRAPITEDVDLDGILDGRLPGLPNGELRSAPHNQVHEDTGLDLVPDFYDLNNDGAYQAGLDRPGEFTSTVDFPSDPHGDNRYTYDTVLGWWDTDEEINPDGTEGNGQIDARDDNDIQKVTVVIGWREGGQDRYATFSAAIPNQFR